MFLPKGPVLRGALFSLLGFIAWSCSDAFTKSAGLGNASPSLILEISGWGALLVFFFSAVLKGQISKLRPQNRKLYVLQFPFFILNSFACTIAFIHLPMTTVYIGLFSCPFLISLYGSIFMKEPLHQGQAAGILIGFIGIVVALLPEIRNAAASQGNLVLGYAALVVFIFSYIGSMLFLKILGRTETEESTAFVPFLVRTLLLLPFLWIDHAATISSSAFLASFAMGILVGFGFLFMSAAYKLAPVAIVAPFHYCQLLTGALFGYLFWDTVPSLWMWGGGALIIASGLMIGREAHKQEKRAEVPA